MFLIDLSPVKGHLSHLLCMLIAEHRYCVAVEEGLHKLWQGVTPAIYRHIGISLFMSLPCVV